MLKRTNLSGSRSKPTLLVSEGTRRVGRGRAELPEPDPLPIELPASPPPFQLEPPAGNLNEQIEWLDSRLLELKIRLADPKRVQKFRAMYPSAEPGTYQAWHDSEVGVYREYKQMRQKLWAARQKINVPKFDNPLAQYSDETLLRMLKNTIESMLKELERLPVPEERVLLNAISRRLKKPKRGELEVKND